ncbi:esterase-like activity of phytase family protein [Cellulomonas fimi]|uniref:LPXTG-motif cell wall anchor domain protein n=1 Tax=Cellulomonas fimi (strain ATCC 484 / DSM 20113 / JCM 1341 / CCUG 24087 / LMG 16345 / NBRC 15513 / NCIMB 8980 / NCTC 7547 / NRS-133) TaxID=590998 RepID=F4H5C9_CELFA|nr:esterase-like activity of phytase family protein [Cellulomonas fimi]AEE47852.1 LPXTG-motif cell wall anchor domain protein [Cellulomonas fimi ATCC 484]NNH06010.1 esterase-like activity of phytase family protein [Cellulomonas fimi]
MLRPQPRADHPVGRRRGTPDRGTASPRTATVALATAAAALAAGLATTAAAAPARTAVADAAAVSRPAAADWSTPTAEQTFHRLATYPVHLNRPAGEDPTAETVAEISAVSDDGRTFVHTDALARRIGFVDITDPGAPAGLGTLDLHAGLGVGEHAEPTSVAVVGNHVLVVVDTSASFTDPSGVLAVVDLRTRTLVRTLDLGGQPDSIALAPDRRHAAIAIENQRDEDASPADGDEGDLPQAPGGFLQLLDLPDTADPGTWTTRAVPFTAPDGSALPSFVAAGLDTPHDPEPEYVAVDPTGTTVAVTLQENNGVVLVDLASGSVTRVFSAGSAAVTGVDVTKDGRVDQTGALPTRPREPDAVAWLDAGHLATANEGDWKGGTRGWTVFDTTGAVVWDAGAELERLAVRVGLHTEDRAAKKGVEPEGLAVATLGGTPYAFVGSERSNFVAVYDVTVPAVPRFVQVLATTNGPEGLLPVPSRDLLLVSSEEDDASALVRSSVTVFGRGPAHAAASGTPAFPSVVSADDGAGNPIGWGALGALTADPADDRRLWSATDAAYTPTRLLSLDVSGTPAVVDREVMVTRDGAPVGLDVEGVAARAGGGFWLGVEGATGAANQLVRLDASGAVVETVPLPADVASGLTKWGVEGVAVAAGKDGEHVFVALQRGLTTDPGGLGGTARIGRFDVDHGTWTWFAYPLETTSTTGDWIGLSEVTAVDHDTLAVVERDKLNGPTARVKRVYAVDLPADPAPGTVGTLTKDLVRDVLPDLRATHGWTQEKLEGLTVGGDGTVWAVTDNDGAVDATGETVLMALGDAADVFAGHLDAGPTPTPTPSVSTPVPSPSGTPGAGAGATPGAGPTRPDVPRFTPTADGLTDANRGGVTVDGTPRAGGTITVRGAGFVPGEWVQVWLFSAPTALGWARADATGAVEARLTIPSSVAPGTHRLALVGQVDGRTVWVEVQVRAASGRGAGALATTGADGVTALALVAAGLVAAGGAVVVATRRRPGLAATTRAARFVVGRR